LEPPGFVPTPWLFSLLSNFITRLAPVIHKETMVATVFCFAALVIVPNTLAFSLMDRSHGQEMSGTPNHKVAAKIKEVAGGKAAAVKDPNGLCDLKIFTGFDTSVTYKEVYDKFIKLCEVPSSVCPDCSGEHTAGLCITGAAELFNGLSMQADARLNENKQDKKTSKTFCRMFKQLLNVNKQWRKLQDAVGGGDAKVNFFLRAQKSGQKSSLDQSAKMKEAAE